MKVIHLYVLLSILLFTPLFIKAQDKDIEDALIYRTEVFGSVATSSTTPFWTVSNKYGKIPLDSNNALLTVGVFQKQHLGKGFYWNAGLDLVASTSRYRNIFLQQLYAEVGYKALLLSIGSKEKYTSLWDRSLSSGDMVFSSNARPIPEINLSIPEFAILPWTAGWLQVKGDFAVGKSFDTRYLEHFVNDGKTYVTDILWHHKSFYLQVLDTQNGSPFSATLGIQHWAQWGGTSTNPRIGKQPQSLKDLIRIIMFKEGGSDATINDQDNALGNHYGSYDIKFSYNQKAWKASVYHQRFFEDKSGVEWANRWDGIWGAEIELKHISWLRKIVFEVIETRNQSGPFHFLDFDRDAHTGRGGGADNYYNNGEYVTGVSYFNRSLASPLLRSPEYNEDGSLGFKCNRINDWHLGANGDINDRISYRFLFTIMNNWGTHYSPYLSKKAGTSCLVDITYQNPRLKD
ncbi:MAG: capsule assembly Wzi family protein [Tannerellaceae bacterium]|nr:capsule assembly Wzi family protein [Tannerellaceae bacterium]